MNFVLCVAQRETFSRFNPAESLCRTTQHNEDILCVNMLKLYNVHEHLYTLYIHECYVRQSDSKYNANSNTTY